MLKSFLISYIFRTQSSLKTTTNVGIQSPQCSTLYTLALQTQQEHWSPQIHCTADPHWLGCWPSVLSSDTHSTIDILDHRMENQCGTSIVFSSMILVCGTGYCKSISCSLRYIYILYTYICMYIYVEVGDQSHLNRKSYMLSYYSEWF